MDQLAEDLLRAVNAHDDGDQDNRPNVIALNDRRAIRAFIAESLGTDPEPPTAA